MAFGAARAGFWFLPKTKETVLDPGSTFTFVAEYLTISYHFTSGTDLDTRTQIGIPLIKGYPGIAVNTDYIGWGRDAVSTYATLIWGGDNQGIGEESLLCNLNTIKTLYGPTRISIDCNCFWYGTVGTTPVSIVVTLYKGGTMVKAGYSWINSTAIEKVTVASLSRTITMKTQNIGTNGQHLSTLVYDIPTHQGWFA